MSWPRRHELIDVDLDAYADSEGPSGMPEAQPVQHPPVVAAEQPRISRLEAAELAGIPLEELLPKFE